MLRPGLVGFVAREGKDPELIASATKLAGEWLDSRKPLPSVTINEIFSCAGRNGDAALYYRILTAAKAEKDELYQRALIGALGSFPQAELVQRNLQTVLDGAFDLRIAGFPLLFGALNDPATEQLPLQMIMAHYDEIVAKLPTAAGSDYAGFLPQAAAQKCSAADAKEVQAFFGPRMEKVNGGPRNLAQVVESIKLCEERKKVQQPDLIQFFTGL